MLESHFNKVAVLRPANRPANFSFRPDSVEEVKKVIRDLKTNKAVCGEIPTKLLK